MNDLKTNRSVKMYVIFTVLIMLSPIITWSILINRLMSGMKGLTNLIIHGIGTGMNSYSFLAPFIIIQILCLAYTVYKIVLFYGVFKDADTICEKYRIGGLSLPYPLVWILSILTINIFYVIWSKLMGKRLKDVSDICRKPINGTPGYHMLFAIFESLPKFVILLFIIAVKSEMANLRLYVFLLIMYVISFLFSFIGICNMAGFISDVNALAEVCNEQVSVTGDRYESVQKETMLRDDNATIPSREWLPETKSSWKQDMPSGGIIEGCKGIYEGAQIPVEEEIVIGRDEMSCNIVIKMPEVSRKHCGIRYNLDGSYTVIDYSTNGIYYKNGQAFPKNTPVICSAGTIIVIARSGNEFILK